MSGATNFDVRAGLPFSRRVRVTDGQNVWASVDDFEARMHIRVAENPSSTLRFNFTPFLTKVLEGNDIVIEWDMTGAETRTLREGYYDLILSDLGVIDSRAIRLLYGQFNILPVITTAEGAL